MHLLISVRRVVNLGVSGEILVPTEVLSPVP